MHETQNNEANEQEVRRPVRRKRRKSLLPAFLTHIGADVKWYYDIRLWSPLILLLLILAFLPGRKQEPAEQTPTAPTVETQATEPTAPTEVSRNPEAEALAILADSVGAGRSRNCKIIIMWVAINRSEDRSNGYGLSLVEEIERPDQWQGYDKNVKYSEASYNLALEVLDIQKNGDLRPLDSGMLFLVLNDDGSVTVRNQFKQTGNKPWIEKTVK